MLSDELQLTLYVRGNGDNIEPLRSILDMINELISEWLKKRAEVFVPCIRCLRGGVCIPFFFFFFVSVWLLGVIYSFFLPQGPKTPPYPPR